MSSSVRSLATLLKQADIEDHEEILQAADLALKQNKGDSETQHVRVVALLKLDRYEDAVKAVEAGGAKLKESGKLEYAYALYKSGKPTEAANLVNEATGRGEKHVEAQSRYRIEDFSKAARLYGELSTNTENDADLDLRINSGAVDAQLEWSAHGESVTKKKPGREDLEVFETAYNAACTSIARGELSQAEVLLKRAKDLCNASEDMSDRDKLAELLPITVQRVYVLTRLGRIEEAETLSRSIDLDDVSNDSKATRHVTQVNNVAASTSSANPFMTQRLVARDLNKLKPDYPFRFQASILESDRYAADLQSLKYRGVIDSTSEAISKASVPNLDSFHNSLSVVNAAAHVRSATGKEALKHILPILEKRPNDVGLLLTIVQLYILTGNSGSAINLLESFLSLLEQSGTASELDVRFAPGLVGAMVSLYHTQNRRSQIQRELSKAAIHWRRKLKERPAGVVQLLKTAGSTLLESNDTEHQNLAKEIFAELHDQDGNDRFAIAGLLATSPKSESTTQTSSLTSIDRLVAGIDTYALEHAGIAQPPSAPGAAVTIRKRPAEEIKPRKAKKIKKSRMPKDFDPNKKPDPERWLPLRDRSTYRPKGKKGKARANLFSQGAAPAVDSEGSRPGTPGGEVVKPKQQGGGGGKKKKGKGK